MTVLPSAQNGRILISDCTSVPGVVVTDDVEIVGVSNPLWNLCGEPIVVKSGRLVLRGLRIDQPGQRSAISILGGNVRIEDCTISGAGRHTIHIVSGQLHTKNSHFPNSRNRIICVEDGSQLWATDCTFSSGRVGVYIRGGSVHISNTVFDNLGSVGVCIKGCGQARLEHVVINQINDAGILVSDRGSVWADNLVLTDCGAALSFQSTNDSEICNGRIRGCRVGVWIAHGSNPQLVDCQISAAKTNGAYVAVGGRGRLSRCTFSDSPVAICVMNESSSVFTNCRINDDCHIGIIEADQSQCQFVRMDNNASPFEIFRPPTPQDPPSSRRLLPVQAKS